MGSSNFGDIAGNTDQSTIWPAGVTGQIVGITNGASATTGSVGEDIFSIIATGSAASLTSGTAANVTSITLSAGDWDVMGVVTLKYNAATQSADGQASISVSSALLMTNGQEVYDNTRQTTTTSNKSLTISRVRINVTSPASTITYLVAKATFSAGTCGAFGYIHARRVR